MVICPKPDNHTFSSENSVWKWERKRQHSPARVLSMLYVCCVCISRHNVDRQRTYGSLPNAGACKHPLLPSPTLDISRTGWHQTRYLHGNTLRIIHLHPQVYFIWLFIFKLLLMQKVEVGDDTINCIFGHFMIPFVWKPEHSTFIALILYSICNFKRKIILL